MTSEEVSLILRSRVSYKPKADDTLMRQRKSDLVSLIRVLEHNWAAAEWGIAQQAENVKDWEPVKHGHWVKVRWVKTPLQPDEGYWIVRCSACHIPNCSTFRYCPHCGAKMDEEAGNENQ